MNGIAEIEELRSELAGEMNLNRVIGKYSQDRPGPTLICIGGMHGNEPAGVTALQRVLDYLHASGAELAGQFVALRGNLRALAQKKRYIETDFNRMWTPERMARLRSDEIAGAQNAESLEQFELFRKIDSILAETRGPAYLIDLHTTSAPSQPFAIFGDTIRNRRFAKKLGVPLILGLEEAIAGTLMEDITNQGHVALAFESGQHDDPRSIELHESAIWLALEGAGCMSRRDVPNIEVHRKHLSGAAQNLPEVLEVCYRHAIKPTDHFNMMPGFVNFQQVYEGQLLARDRHDWIWAPKNLNIFMPLYQGLGDDGFFLARPVHTFWLKVSAALRYLRVDRILHSLPGVRRHPKDAFTYIVDTRIARWLVVEIFHLLGFRKERTENGSLILSKRRYDLSPPKKHR